MGENYKRLCGKIKICFNEIFKAGPRAVTVQRYA